MISKVKKPKTAKPIFCSLLSFKEWLFGCKLPGVGIGAIYENYPSRTIPAGFNALVKKQMQ